MSSKRTVTGRTTKKVTRRSAGNAKADSAAGALALADSDAVKARALTAFRKLGTVTAACEAAKVPRQRWYDWLNDDAGFASLARDAVEGTTDELEQAAHARAVDGSDTLLIFLLKSRRPEKYRETVKLDIVSPQVVDRLTRTYAILSHTLTPEQWATVEPQLNEVWQ